MRGGGTLTCGVIRQPAASKPEGGWGDYRDYKNVQFHGDEVVYVSIGEG